MDAPEYTLLVDGTCRLCARLVTTVRAWDRDGRVECVPYQDPSVPARFPRLAPAALAGQVHLVAADGATWTGAAAIERLLGLMPRGRALAWVFRLPLAGRIAEHVYRRVARDRHRFGCVAHGAGDER